jgi:hypothetical protein
VPLANRPVRAGKTNSVFVAPKSDLGASKCVFVAAGRGVGRRAPEGQVFGRLRLSENLPFWSFFLARMCDFVQKRDFLLKKCAQMCGR